jgi:hypothetical protein
MSVRWLKNGSFGFACVTACAVGAKPNVPFVRLAKIVFKKVRRKKNKKHRVGNECRLTRCPFAISFLCRWSPVKMVFLSFLVVCLLLSGRPLRLHLTYLFMNLLARYLPDLDKYMHLW